MTGIIRSERSDRGIRESERSDRESATEVKRREKETENRNPPISDI